MVIVMLPDFSKNAELNYIMNVHQFEKNDQAIQVKMHILISSKICFYYVVVTLTYLSFISSFFLSSKEI
jgi:hypothetical protein